MHGFQSCFRLMTKNHWWTIARIDGCTHTHTNSHQVTGLLRHLVHQEVSKSVILCFPHIAIMLHIVVQVGLNWSCFAFDAHRDSSSTLPRTLEFETVPMPQPITSQLCHCESFSMYDFFSCTLQLLRILKIIAIDITPWECAFEQQVDIPNYMTPNGIQGLFGDHQLLLQSHQ